MGVEWCTYMSSLVKTVCALDFKIAIERESKDGTVNYQRNLYKSVATARIIRKRSSLAENIGFGHFNAL